MGNQQAVQFTYKSAVDGHDFDYNPDYNQSRLIYAFTRQSTLSRMTIPQRETHSFWSQEFPVLKADVHKIKNKLTSHKNDNPVPISIHQFQDSLFPFSHDCKSFRRVRG